MCNKRVSNRSSKRRIDKRKDGILLKKSAVIRILKLFMVLNVLFVIAVVSISVLAYKLFMVNNALRERDALISSLSQNVIDLEYKLNNIEMFQNDVIKDLEEAMEKKEQYKEPRKEDSVDTQISHPYFMVVDKNVEFKFDHDYQDYLYMQLLENDKEEYFPLFVAQIYHESKFNKDVISSTNDYGLMQINKSNHGWIKRDLGLDNMLDPYQNIEAGVYMMNKSLNEYDCDIEKALSIYNTGRVLSTTPYSRAVLSDMDKLVVEVI